MSREKLWSTLDESEHIFKDLLQNGLKQIAKMRNLSQNELKQITKMQNLSQNELEQIAKMRHIKNYKNMSREELLIATLKSKQSHELLIATLKSKQSHAELHRSKDMKKRFKKDLDLKKKKIKI